MSATVLLILLSTALAGGAWLLFLWAVRSQQFDDPEGPKHRMLEEEEEGKKADGEDGRGEG